MSSKKIRANSNELYNLCHNHGQDHTEQSWNNVRKWLYTNRHNNSLFISAANYTENDLGLTPLHLMVMKQPPADVVEIFLDQTPETFQKRDNMGCLALHNACRYKASQGVVRMLLQAYQGGAKVQDDNGYLPIHDACRYKASQNVIRLLLQTYQGGAKVQDVRGRLPLHFACCNNASMDVVSMLLHATGKHARLKDFNGLGGDLPLHYACGNGASLEVLNLLTGAFPDSIDEKGNHGKKPSDMLREFEVRRGINDRLALLRNAVTNKFSVSLVKLLVEAFPESCMTTDENGMTSLHHACANAAAGQVLDVVMALFNASLKSSTITDNYGRTPSQILKQVASQIDGYGMLLLHHQASRGLLTTNSLSFLFNAYPESIAITDKCGLLPFHHACLNESSSLDILMLFLSLYPECIIKDAKCDNGDKKKTIIESGIATINCNMAKLTFEVVDMKSDMVQMKFEIADIKSDMADVKTEITGIKSDMAEIKMMLRSFLGN